MLTNRQLECLAWVRAGKSSSDIGLILDLSRKTVDEHIAAACARLGVRTRTQAVAEAIARGLLEASTPETSG
jgi:DNA-binding CsgD family transcriptional regulator